jgi:hypothetical protein
MVDHGQECQINLAENRMFGIGAFANYGVSPWTEGRGGLRARIKKAYG